MYLNFSNHVLILGCIQRIIILTTIDQVYEPVYVNFVLYKFFREARLRKQRSIDFPKTVEVSDYFTGFLFE